MIIEREHCIIMMIGKDWHSQIGSKESLRSSGIRWRDNELKRATSGEPSNEDEPYRESWGCYPGKSSKNRGN